MDEIVKQALVKWPNVPACYGWLGLDARGRWYMRDDGVQRLGSFDSGIRGSQGSRLEHGKLIEFIQRNYEPDAQGQWFFQNGPQRVYVDLAFTPLIWRVNPDLTVQDHTGRDATVKYSYLDESGHLYLQADTGFGLVHTLDMGNAAQAVEQGVWSPDSVIASDLPAQFGYVKNPKPVQKT